MIRARFGALAGALILPAALWAGGCDGPELMATTFVLADGAKAGGSTLQWSAVSKIASPDAVVSFSVRGPNDEDFAGRESVAKGKVDKSQALAEDFDWTPADGPGRYMVAATVKCAMPLGNSWAKCDVVILDVAKDGTISIGHHVPPTAEQFAQRGLAAANASIRDGLQFGRGALPDAPGLLGEGEVDEKTLNTPFTVKGYVKFTDRPYTDGAFGANTPVPARRATLWVMEDEPTINGDYSLAKTTTSDSGYFEVVIPDNNDGPGEGRRDVYFRLYADTPACGVYDGGGEMYRYQTITKSDWAGGTMDWGTTTVGLPLSGPHHIADTMLRGYDYSKARGSTPARLVVYWVENSGEGSYYQDAANPVYINVRGQFSDPAEFDDDVILHEYGHYLADQFSEDKSNGDDHSWTSEVSPQLAWSEGWATFFAGVVRNNRVYVNHLAGADFWTNNRETPDVGKPGHDCEGAVCGVLWDIWDSSQDYPDSISGGIGRIWPIFDGDFSASKHCTLEDYYNGYKKRNFPDRPKVDLLLNYFGIKFDLAPKLLYPSAAGIVVGHGDDLYPKWEGFDTATVTLRLLNGNSVVSSKVVNNSGSASFKILESFGEGTLFDMTVTSSDGLQWDIADEYYTIVSTEEVLKLNDPANASQLSTDFDYDWYRFVVLSAATVTMQTQSGAAPALGDSVLELYGPNSKASKLATNDDASPTNTMSKIVKTLSAGTYYLKVSGYDGATGNYTVRVTKP